MIHSRKVEKQWLRYVEENHKEEEGEEEKEEEDKEGTDDFTANHSTIAALQKSQHVVDERMRFKREEE